MSKKTYLIIILILVIVALISLVLFIKSFDGEKPFEAPFGIEGEDKEIDTSDDGIKSLVEIPVDFEKLWETNTDVYAWINIPDTNIDYPILQGDDNTYYLNHTWDKKEYKAGSIFTETYNSKEFDDPNTIIYGHRMYAGDMFAQLQNFSEADFFDSHRTVYIYTPSKILVYEIVAAFPFSDEHLLYKYNFFDKDDYNRFCEDVFSTVDFRASFLEGAQLDFEKDKLITLSTCLKGNSNRRYLVVARLIEVKE